MSEIEQIENGPSGSYGDVVASGGYAEESGRRVTGYDHPSVFQENADPRAAGAVDYGDMKKAELRALVDQRELGLPQRATNKEMAEALAEHDAQNAAPAEAPASDLDAMTREQLEAEASALGVDIDGLDDDELRDAIEDEREGV